MNCKWPKIALQRTTTDLNAGKLASDVFLPEKFICQYR